MILDDLVAATRRRMERDMKRAPLEYVMKRAESVRKTELAQAEKGRWMRRWSLLPSKKI